MSAVWTRELQDVISVQSVMISQNSEFQNLKNYGFELWEFWRCAWNSPWLFAFHPQLTRAEFISNFQSTTNPFKCLANTQIWESIKKTKPDWHRWIYLIVVNWWLGKCTNLFQWMQLPVWKRLPPSLSLAKYFRCRRVTLSVHISLYSCLLWLWLGKHQTL